MHIASSLDQQHTVTFIAVQYLPYNYNNYLKQIKEMFSKKKIVSSSKKRRMIKKILIKKAHVKMWPKEVVYVAAAAARRQRTEAVRRAVISALIALTGYTVDASAFPRSRSAELAGGAANCRQICVPPVGNCKNHSPHRGTSLWSLYYKNNSCVQLLWLRLNTYTYV